MDIFIIMIYISLISKSGISPARYCLDILQFFLFQNVQVNIVFSTAFQFLSLPIQKKIGFKIIQKSQKCHNPIQDELPAKQFRNTIESKELNQKRKGIYAFYRNSQPILFNEYKSFEKTPSEIQITQTEKERKYELSRVLLLK